MYQLVDLVKENNVIIFFLLFTRISGFVAFMPFFSHNLIPISIKSAFAIFLTLFFFPLAFLIHVPNTPIELFVMILSELMIGFSAGLFLNIVFATLSYAGSQIAMVMGFSMSTILDPSSGTNAPIVSNILTLLALLIFLTFNGHHLILLFLAKSVATVKLGGFVVSDDILGYFIKAFAHLFVMGFIISFPIIALSILADTVFGMLMKTMPQFNLLVVGYPIKIFLSIMVLGAVLGSMMHLFYKDFLRAFEYLKLFI